MQVKPLGDRILVKAGLERRNHQKRDCFAGHG